MPSKTQLEKDAVRPKSLGIFFPCYLTLCLITFSQPLPPPIRKEDELWEGYE